MTKFAFLILVLKLEKFSFPVADLLRNYSAVEVFAFELGVCEILSPLAPQLDSRIMKGL
jgi:hypothetical protein